MQHRKICSDRQTGKYFVQNGYGMIHLGNGVVEFLFRKIRLPRFTPLPLLFLNSS